MQELKLVSGMTLYAVIVLIVILNVGSLFNYLFGSPFGLVACLFSMPLGVWLGLWALRVFWEKVKIEL